jgi:hypothetical protein
MDSHISSNILSTSPSVFQFQISYAVVMITKTKEKCQSIPGCRSGIPRDMKSARILR